MAKRMGAETIEVNLSLISQPDMITNVILDAAGSDRFFWERWLPCETARH
jgi:hypothetical protein